MDRLYGYDPHADETVSGDGAEFLRQGNDWCAMPKGIIGVPPAILLCNPKFPRNVGSVLRACSCYGLEQLWFTGNRVMLRGDGKEYRLPREERMKGYAEVSLFQTDRPFSRFLSSAVTPVCVELSDNAEDLTHFEHPENPLYVFGPEDGSVPKATRVLCHKFVVIPTRHCLNLSAAVYTVLYDRQTKARAR